MADLLLRPATRGDLPRIVELLHDDVLGERREASFADERDRYELAFEAISSDPRQHLAVADVGGVVVGTLQLSFIQYLTYVGGERAQIEAVRVDASMRSQGIGRRMIEWAISEATARGCHLVQLTTDKRREDAQAFYESLGFLASHEGLKLHLA